MRQNRKVRHAVPQVGAAVWAAARLRLCHIRSGKCELLSTTNRCNDAFRAQVASAHKALDKLSGHQVGCKTMVIRLAKNINYDELDRHGRRLDIPALTVGGAPSAAASAASATAIAAAATAASSAKKLSTQSTIQAIEAKLRSLENNAGTELVINQPAGHEPPLIHRYQYNSLMQDARGGANGSGQGRGGPSGRYSTTKSRYGQGPYSRRGGASTHRR